MKSLIAAYSLAIVMTSLTAAQILVPTPVPVTPYSQVVTFLNLTDGQLQSLEQIQQQQRQAAQNLYNQISAKQTLLTAQLKLSSPDPTQVGQLTIDIRALLLQLQQVSKPFRQPALAVLTSDQQIKLQLLVSALQLQQPAGEAVSLNLIDSVGLVFPTEPLVPGILTLTQEQIP